MSDGATKVLKLRFEFNFFLHFYYPNQNNRSIVEWIPTKFAEVNVEFEWTFMYMLARVDRQHPKMIFIYWFSVIKVALTKVHLELTIFMLSI